MVQLATYGTTCEGSTDRKIYKYKLLILLGPGKTPQVLLDLHRILGEEEGST